MAAHKLHQDAGTALDHQRWRAVLARDRASDGRFVFAVRTTGIVCRPSCGARHPRRENVAFFDTLDAALGRGFRPCKRCHPERADDASDLAAAACRIVGQADPLPSVGELAEAIGVTPVKLLRLFNASIGLTPKAYISAERARRLREGLRSAGSVTAAFHEAGFGSSSRFYDTAEARLGMPPRSYRAGGVGIEITYATGTSTLGVVAVAATARGVCAIELGDTAADVVARLMSRFPKAALRAGGPEFRQTVSDAIAAVERPERATRLPLDVQGTAFQEQVWRALRSIPPGRTTTYAELAGRLGRPSAARAVATAVAANPVAVLIPCHRVVRTGGGLGGYRWGIDRKRKILARETAERSKTSKP